MDGKDVYLSTGLSGRPNSGVMILKNTQGSRQFLVDVFKAAGKNLPKEHRVGWGENGEVIHVASSYSGYQNISYLWNNTRNSKAEDYVRHFNAGPMRKYYPGKLDSESLISSLKQVPATQSGSPEFYRGLMTLLRSNVDPQFFETPAVIALIADMEAAKGCAP